MPIGIKDGSDAYCQDIPPGWWPSVWGGAATLLLFFGVSLITRPPDNAERFIASVEAGLSAYRFRYIRK